MRFTNFEFRNFRGIHHTTLNLTQAATSPINVLVGLNESGKTTILEAINNFYYKLDLTKYDPTSAKRTDKDYQAMIPIAERANFGGKVSIKATVALDRYDIGLLDEYLKENFQFTDTERVPEFTIEQVLYFKDSKHVRTNNTWSIPFRGRKKGQRKYHGLDGDDWQKAVAFTAGLLPQIVYFPTTLFEFPDQIFLESGNDDKSAPQQGKNEFYCQVFADILRALSPSLTLEKHVLERFNSPSPIERQNLEALLLKAEQHLTTTVLTVWESIFQQKLEGKRFRIILQKDESRRTYLQIKLVDGGEIFNVNERSAGFRWFFVFILITRYRIHRNDPVLFLFDEPAANLHPNAQAQLLKSFVDLGQYCQIIYSTHSHYLINPAWLSSTFIVKNQAVENNSNPLLTNSATTNISVTPYRQFLGSHPDQYFYYKPILDVLDYAPAPTDFPDKAVLVEGKTDYYLLALLLRSSGKEGSINIFPGGGAGSLDTLISLLAGWGKKFVVLLDSDEEGRKQKARYQVKFETLLDARLFTLDEINPKYKGNAIEALLHRDDVADICTLTGINKKNISKKELHRCIQEILATNKVITPNASTLEDVDKIISFFSNAIASIG